jgi:hypothetical protein
LVTVTLVINLPGRLLLPKLVLIWKGEKVVVSRILRDHKLSLRNASGDSSVWTPSSHFRTGASTDKLEEEKEKPKRPKSSRAASLASVVEEAEAATAPTETGNGSSVAENGNEEAVADHKNISWSGEVVHNSVSSLDPASEVENPSRHQMTPLGSESEATTTSESTPLVIRPGHAPPSAICVGISMHSQLLSRINNRILSGLEVPEHDWEELRTSFSDMHSIFGQNLKYQWEN